MKPTPVFLLTTVAASIIIGCSGSNPKPGERDSVCFVLDGDWAEIGRFQRQFVKGDSYLPGVRGFELHLSPDYLEINLLDGVDPKKWTVDLPNPILDDPVVTRTFPVSEGGCGSALS